MSNLNQLIRKRVESIDILRGIAMVIMALDHVRDNFHIGSNLDNPLNLATTTPQLFFTRWITHFCAPAFVFLSGASIFLQAVRKSKKDLSRFLFKRGCWLILIEVSVISFGWTFNPHYNLFIFQVIWAIGISMVLMSAIVFLPYRWILAIGLIVVFGHNLLDFSESASGFHHSFIQDLLHSGLFSLHPVTANHAILIVYPFLPWTGLMMIGFCFGKCFTGNWNEASRRKLFLQMGIGSILLFIILRFINIYGDPRPWTIQKNALFSFLSFININKYPPSLSYILLTIGVALLILALIEPIQNRFTRTMSIYGRVAFFYYILHIYVIHLLSVIAFFARGHSLSEASQTGKSFPFYFVTAGEGFNLPGVYLVWLLVILIMYPLCKWYDRYKSAHRHKWWLSYL